MIAYSDARGADGPALDAMARESWIATFGHASSAEDMAAFLSTAYGPDGALLRDLGDPRFRFRLARAGMEGGGAVAGYAKLGPYDLTPGLVPAGTIRLHQLYVLAPWHGAGVGPALMDWATDAARGQGAPALALTVWEENGRARAFYRRRGFREVGEHIFMTGAQADRDLILRLDL